MNDLETRLRRAFEAGTAHVQTPPEPDWTHRTRRAYPILATMAAIAATVAILLTVNHIWGGSSDTDPTFAPGTVAVSPVRPATTPTFAIRQEIKSPPTIVDVATGRVLGNVETPKGYNALYSESLTAAADNRTFFFSVRKKLNSPRYMVARVHVDERGRPDGRAVLVATAPMRLNGLSASPDATKLAMSVTNDQSETLTIWDLSTGGHKTWDVPPSAAPNGVESVVWTPGGSLLWASGRSAGKLDPESAPGPLHADRTFPNVGDLTDSELLPNGDRIAVLHEEGNVRFIRISSRPGASMRVLDHWVPEGDDEGGLIVSGGRYVLYLRHGQMVRMDLTTHTRTPSPLGGPDNKMAGYAW
ncbi:hypothetical protein J4573_01320 [Actinomadura barringtoniae]|uniref:WD40 repeat domain-containing protein n=1 Tax=Actinomadura barringtoniae TaxID=1427535 RepID=A0A939P5M0_9ACTN|nr:hypothetical protein [Actinomadura barringtoniae]MBO2445721.1 hypothetical protein [Actinomadura barringtoniae]